jgi:hypothetical protein
MGSRNLYPKGGGPVIRERLLSLSDAEYSFSYCIINRPMPVAGYVASLQLLPVTVSDHTLGIWRAEFEVTEGPEAPIIDRVANQTFATAFASLNAYFAGASGR